MTERTEPAGLDRRPGVPEPIGPLLTRLRQLRGLTQLRVAERLCAAAGVLTITRHEVSRWERGERVPGRFWLSWLAVVLDVPVGELAAAATLSRRPPAASPARSASQPSLWTPPSVGQLQAALDQPGGSDLLGLAHRWLAEPPPPIPVLVRLLPATSTVSESLDQLTARLAELRRMDDLVGGVDLAGLVDRELGAAIALRALAGQGRHQRRALRLVAGYAQLAGWVRADAGDPVAADQAYQVAVHAAAAARDQALAGYVLSAASHHRLGVEGSAGASDPATALLLARTAHTGAHRYASARTRALFHQRIALAAALAGERRAAHAALSAADHAADRSQPGQEPAWLYWFDDPELAAMTGRCLVALGRPLRGARLLAAPRPRVGPRTAALYGSCLARAYLALGEIEQASRLARRSLRQAVAVGSPRAAAALRTLHPLLLRHRDLSAVRGYERRAGELAEFLPTPGDQLRGQQQRRPAGR